jgi:hypothetical protein
VPPAAFLRWLSDVDVGTFECPIARRGEVDASPSWESPIDRHRCRRRGHMSTFFLVAARSGSGDLIVGLLIGIAIGFLAGPILRHWLAWREWTEASREDRLTDDLLTRLEEDVPFDDEEFEGQPETDQPPPRVRWRKPH